MRTLLQVDDFGLTAPVTMRILAAWRAGRVDGLSVVAGGEALDRAADGLAEDPARPVRLAVHLNLTEGRACAPAGTVPLLTGGSRRLSASFTGLGARWLLGGTSGRRRLLEQVEREWRAQIAVVAERFRPRRIDALDGHRHVHMLPFLFPVATRLAREHGIPEIRFSREPFHLSPEPRDSFVPEFAANVVKHAVLRACAAAASRALRESGLASPDCVVGVLYTGILTRRSVEAGLRVAERSGSRTTELMLHIASAAEDGTDAGSWPPVPPARGGA